MTCNRSFDILYDILIIVEAPEAIESENSDRRTGAEILPYNIEFVGDDFRTSISFMEFESLEEVYLGYFFDQISVFAAKFRITIAPPPPPPPPPPPDFLIAP